MTYSDFFFDTQNPNPNSNLVREMEDVLCIFSYCGVFILDMDAILSDEDYEEETSLKRPPLKRILNFVESGLPFGMGLVKFENFLYMFGGEYPSGDPDLPVFHSGPMVYGLGIPQEDPPCPVFRLDLTNDLSELVSLRPMLGPKLYAIVEEIEGKIYVLSQERLSSSLPMFEVLNPLTEEWRTLPSPFEPSDSSTIGYHCVSGRDIICKMSGSSYNIYWRFSTVIETWESTKDISSSEEMAMHGRLDARYEDVYLTLWGKDRELWAILDGLEQRDGYSIEVNSTDIQPHVPDFKMYYHATLADTSEQGEYMCGLVPYISAEDNSFALYVFVFQVEKHESEKVPPSQGALSITYLKRQVYYFTSIKSQSKQSPNFFIREAVIGRLSYNTSIGSGEAKRKDDGQVDSIHGLH